MIITQCVILARASGKLIFIHENKVFDCYFLLNLAETKTKSYASVNSSCAQPPPGHRGAFARLVSPGGGAFAKFALPGAGHLPTLGPTLSFDTHAVSY